jgi:hypothetical protein
MLFWGQICFVALAFSAGATAFAVGRYPRRARQLWLLTSLLHLVFIPVGPIVGLAGLFCLTRPSFKEWIGSPKSPNHTSEPVHQPLPGDGTNRKSQHLFDAATYVLYGVLFLLVRRWAGGQELTSGNAALPWIAAIPAAFALSVLIHELGHAAGAWACHFRLVDIRVGPIHCYHLEGRWRFQFVWAGFVGGGQVAALPTRPERIREGALFIIAGGPVASLLVGLTSGLLLISSPGAVWERAWTLLAALAVICLGDSVLNLLPIGLAQSYSDGARLWQLSRRGPWCDHLVFGLYRGLSKTTMLSPLEWPEEEVIAAPAFEGTPLARLGDQGVAAFYFRLKGDPQRAEPYVRRVQDLLPRLNATQASHFSPEVVIFHAAYRNDLQEARRWAAFMNDHSISDYWLAQSALCGGEGLLQEGREALEKARKTRDSAPPSGFRTADESTFDFIARRWYPDLVSRMSSPSLQEVPAVAIA